MAHSLIQQEPLDQLLAFSTSGIKTSVNEMIQQAIKCKQTHSFLLGRHRAEQAFM